MPYATDNDLPDRVRKSLPKHAREIYRKAYNNAWKQYAAPRKRTRGGSLEEVANRVAWAAVKHIYQKVGSRWVRK